VAITLRTIGIDPGSRFMGYGVIDKSGNKIICVASGVIQADTKLSVPERLKTIHEELSTLIGQFSPQHFAIEKAFFAKDALAALKLGQARGVALLAAVQNKVEIFEYSPNEVKKAVSGHGHADKDVMARMVSLLIGIRDFERSDASDALAIAICHANSYAYNERVGRALTSSP
jgi:crossover junction endodeoxyribonuclease RuvC